MKRLKMSRFDAELTKTELVSESNNCLLRCQVVAVQGVSLYMVGQMLVPLSNHQSRTILIDY